MFHVSYTTKVKILGYIITRYTWAEFWERLKTCGNLWSFPHWVSIQWQTFIPVIRVLEFTCEQTFNYGSMQSFLDVLIYHLSKRFLCSFGIGLSLTHGHGWWKLKEILRETVSLYIASAWNTAFFYPLLRIATSTFFKLHFWPYVL